jgi:general secretion pathway protein J
LPSHQNRQQGFTLLELMIASIIFAIMAIMAYGGLDNVMDNSEASQQALNRLKQAQHTVTILNRDLNQLVQRDIRDGFGNKQPYLVAGTDVDNLVEFTRSGRVNPGRLIRSSLQRVTYRFEEDKLIRLQWPQLDRTQEMEAKQSVLIDELEQVTIRFLDQDNEWQEQWPPLNAQVSAPTAGGTGATAGTAIGPVAIEVILQLKDWGDIRRLYEVQL